MVVVEAEQLVFSLLVVLELLFEGLGVGGSFDVEGAAGVACSVFGDGFGLGYAEFPVFNVTVVVNSSTICAFMLDFLHFSQKSLRHRNMHKGIHTPVHLLKRLSLLQILGKIIKYESVSSNRLNSQQFLHNFLLSEPIIVSCVNHRLDP